MAAPTFVQAGAGAIWETGAGITTSMTGVTVGNVCILQILNDGTLGSPVFTNQSGYESLAAVANTTTDVSGTALVGNPTAAHQRVRIARATATTVTVDIANSSTTDFYMRWYEFTGVNTGATLAEVVENGASQFANGAGTAAQIDDTAVTTNGADRLACQFVAVNDDNAVGAFTGMTGGTWAEPVAEFLSATGTDGCIQLQTATIASAGTINGGSFTMLASDSWGVVGLALIPASAVAATSLIYQPAPSSLYGR